MMLFSTKACLTLLWGISALFSTGTKSVSIPETSSSNSTAEPNNGPLTTEHVPYNETETQPTSWDPTQQPAKVTVAAKVEATVSPTMETEEIVVSNRSDSSNDSMAGLVVMNTVATATNSSTVASSPLLHTSTAAVTAAGDAQRSHSTVISETAKPTADRLVKQSPSTSTDVAAPTTTPTATITNSSTVASPALLHTSTAEATTAGDARGSHNSVISETAKPTGGQLGEQSPSASTDMAASATTSTATSSAPASSASTKTTMTTNSTSEAAPVFGHNSLSFTTTETPTTSTEHLSTSQPISGTGTRIATSQSPDSTGSSFTTETLTHTVLNDSDTSTSNGSARILNPYVPKMVPSTRSTPATPATPAAPCEASTNPPSTGGQPCSTRGVVKHCLIAIASLAVLATIFMVSTIVLCTKLSARKYKVKKRPQATEMMCISALLPERNYTYTRQRNPVSNGVLVIPNGRDSDEEGGDNLTLSSFLPENDRIV
ncbi:P-selectin glycoprotein ligand 1 [Toxotes jaculatrix]|uniref:P-selectin glycoprotein ligand 1 n=1 Tax=Toxotes jaculatrix TaxID=941984 RepID=UPI001B3AB4D5|nr:P-selectin glycoprotein ligand 1 [Toxotes jaculatrix]XP_040914659.1 P-selectin glycoprotein ligand 1 [Toxotes jaculatrix]